LDASRGVRVAVVGRVERNLRLAELDLTAPAPGRAKLRTPTRGLALRLGLVAIAAWLVAMAIAQAAAASSELPRPAALAPNVAFWRDIFAKYSEHQVVIHDDWYLDKVYTVLDFRDWAGPDGRLNGAQERQREIDVKAAQERYRRILRRLQRSGGNAAGLGAEERRVRDLFRNVPGSQKYQQAAERVRGQRGLRERFRAGLARQKGYRAEMERILRAHGVPPELAVMPMIESTFDLDAYSKVGAAGVWQFMPRTGREYMRVDALIDERRDPLRSTHAAAQHLRRDRKTLGEWPLAVTAYNHGCGGISRAVRSVGSKDIGRIAREYRGTAFGFASRNFYAELLAAIDVVARENEYFGPIAPVPAPRSREVRLSRPMRVHQAAQHVGVPSNQLVALNPAFLPRVIDGSASIPGGYSLRVPLSARDGHLATTQAAARREEKGLPAYRFHEVKPGQTLAAIARKYGTSVTAIQGLNGVRKPQHLRVGTRLKIPVSG